MEQITPQQFLNGVESGLIFEVFAIGKRVYGKTVRVVPVMGDGGKPWKVVYADTP